MSDELTVNFRMEFIKDNAVNLRLPQQDESCESTYDVTGEGILVKEQVIGTGSSESISGAEDMTANGYIYIKNLDDTNLVSVLGATDGEVIRLLPGDFCFFRTGQTFNTSYKLEASVAACRVLVAWIDG